MTDPQSELLRKIPATFVRLQSWNAFSETVVPEALRPRPAPSPVASSPGAKLSGPEDLEVIRTLATGGMGCVLLARQPSLERDVAVKTVRPDITTPTLSLALLEESRIAGSLEHPNIIPVHSLVTVGSEPALVMKRVDGVPWSELIEAPNHPSWAWISARDDDPLAAHLAVLAAVAGALHFAHRHGIVHRDVKPSNVMLGAFGEVYLVDWGIATALERSDPRYRKDSLGFVGTPSFLAPEMVADDGGVVDARTDVYLLGATLHLLLTGRPRHAAETIGGVLLEATASAPFDYPPTVAPEIGAVANRACHPVPDERYADAAAFRQAILDFLRHRASITLADNAQARLAKLETAWVEARPADPDGRARFRARLLEVQLGFSHALESWPENDRAKSGLRACNLLALRDELALGNLAGAEALRHVVTEVPSEIDAALTALRDEIRLREDRDARHRARERSEDWTRSAGARIAFFVVMLGIGVGLWLLANGGRVRHRGALSPQRLAGSVGVALVVLSGLVALLRKRLLTTRVNELLVFGALLVIAAMFTGRVANLWPVPYSATLVSNELNLCALGASFGGLVLARWLWWQVPVWLAGEFLVRALPGVAGLIFALTAGVALVLGGVGVSRQRDPAA